MSRIRAAAAAWAVISAGMLAAIAVGAPATGPAVTENDLPRVKPTNLPDVMKTMRVRPGFHLELVAWEPNVVDPIAMCFDEDGRMYVVEMRDYSERRAEKLGRIRRLEDTDGDGKYDRATVFADHLPWPTALTCYKGGLLVGACPDIIYFKDTNGDGVADEHRTVFTGFGSTQDRLNVQGLFNNFNWGLDNRIHGCSGHDGGMVTAADHPDLKPLDVRQKGFVIDPRDWSMTTENGGGQYGLSFDHRGRLFTCSNSDHCQVFLYDAKYAARNPYYVMPPALKSIAVDGPAAEVFRASPEEPWRVIRTRWRVAGLVGGPVEGGGRSAGYFTGATGITIYRGDAFGPSYVGDAFIGDAGGNLVHHKHIHDEGVTPVAARPEDEKAIEFVASTDNWFRPVDFANAPDGTLYVADMYRETIEHPWSLPPQIKKFLDLNSGNDRGRIYRLAPDGYKYRPPEKLSGKSSAELVELLNHPNGWHRETAQRLLVERQDRSVVPALREMARKGKVSIGRLHALYVLQGLGALDEGDVVEAMGDTDATVREHGVRLAERFVNEGRVSDSIWGALAKCTEDEGTRVRFQVALTLGDVEHEGREDLLAKVALRDIGDEWVRAAVLSSPSKGAGKVFARLWGDAPRGKVAKGMEMMLGDLARQVGAMGTADEVNEIVKETGGATGHDNRALTMTIWRGLVEGLALAGKADFRPDGPMSNVFGGAVNVIVDTRGDAPEVRAEAVTLLGFGRFQDVGEFLLDQVGSKQPLAVSRAAIAALDRFDVRDVATGLLDRFPKMSNREAQDAIAILVKRPARAVSLLKAVEENKVPADAVPAQQVAFLQNHPDAVVKELARKVLQLPSAKREAVIDQFKSATSLAGDRVKGKAIYLQRCSSCHRAEGEGTQVGPDLVTVKNSGREKLMLSVLDPSREVAASYVSYLIETTDGDNVVGILASDTPANLTVRQAYGKQVVIPREKIKRMKSDGKSLMPDGLEIGLKPQDLADLLEYVSTLEK